MRKRQGGTRSVAVTVLMGAAAVCLPAALVPSGLAAASTSSKVAKASAAGGHVRHVRQAQRSQSVAKAKAFVADHTSLLTKLPITTPLPKSAPKGKTIDVLTDTTPSAVQIATAIKAAARELGWKADVINAGSTPESQASAMSIAVGNHPAAVIGSGFPATTFSKQLSQLREAHIPYVTNGTTDCGTTCNYSSTGVMADVNSTPSNAQVGQWLAEWVTADSNGKATSAIWDLSSYNVLNVVTHNYVRQLHKICPKCSADVQNVTTSSIGTTLPGQIVTYLQSHPSTDYLVMTYGAMTTGLQQALDTAGLADKVKIADDTGSVANLQSIKAGQSEKVFVPYSETLVGWMEVDAVLRALEKAPVTQSEYAYAPRNYLVKSNIITPLANNVAVKDYQQKFLRLWKVSGSGGAAVRDRRHR